MNLNKSFAQGSELEIQTRLSSRLRMDSSYAYTSTQILSAPLGSGPLFSAGAPLLRRPKHSGTLLISYFGNRWGASLAGTFVGPGRISILPRASSPLALCRPSTMWLATHASIPERGMPSPHE